MRVLRLQRKQMTQMSFHVGIPPQTFRRQRRIVEQIDIVRQLLQADQQSIERRRLLAFFTQQLRLRQE